MDPQEGLIQIKEIEQSLTQLERDMKSNKIKEKRLRTSLDILDIDADLFDARSTLQEGRNDANEFIRAGQFPELTPQEINGLLNQLEEEGFVVREEFIPIPESLRGE